MTAAPFARRHPIEPPPGITDPYDAMVLAAACTILQHVHGQPRALATFTEEQFETWRASVRWHRAAWRGHVAKETARAQQAVDQARTAAAHMRAQGQTVGWWHDTNPDMVTPTVPVIHPDEAAAVLHNIDPDHGADWAWQLARATRTLRRRPT